MDDSGLLRLTYTDGAQDVRWIRDLDVVRRCLAIAGAAMGPRQPAPRWLASTGSRPAVSYRPILPARKKRPKRVNPRVEPLVPLAMRNYASGLPGKMLPAFVEDLPNFRFNPGEILKRLDVDPDVTRAAARTNSTDLMGLSFVLGRQAESFCNVV